MNKFFESSYLTWEIIHRKNISWISAQFAHLEYLEENEINTWKYKDTSDYYFQQRPVGGTRPFPLIELNIPAAAFSQALSQYGLSAGSNNSFTEDQHMDGYRSFIHAAHCYSNGSYAIFFSTLNDSVENIWFDYEDHISLEPDRAAIVSLLHSLGEKYEFILVDWYKKLIVELDNKTLLIQYLEDVANGFGDKEEGSF